MSAKTEQFKRVISASTQLRIARLMQGNAASKKEASRLAQKYGLDTSMSVSDAEKNLKAVKLTDSNRKALGLPSAAEKLKQKTAKALHQGKTAVSEAHKLIQSGEADTFLKKQAKKEGFKPPVKRGNPNIGKIRAAQLAKKADKSDKKSKKAKPEKVGKRGNPNIGKIRAAQLAGDTELLNRLLSKKRKPSITVKESDDSDMEKFIKKALANADANKR